jgi:hypothetical protein
MTGPSPISCTCQVSGPACHEAAEGAMRPIASVAFPYERLAHVSAPMTLLSVAALACGKGT